MTARNHGSNDRFMLWIDWSAATGSAWRGGVLGQPGGRGRADLATFRRARPDSPRRGSLPGRGSPPVRVAGQPVDGVRRSRTGPDSLGDRSSSDSAIAPSAQRDGAAGIQHRHRRNLVDASC